MKIALCSSYVPFVRGGYRNIVEWLSLMLIEAGHQVEIIYLPEVDNPDSLFQQMMAYRWIDLDVADRIICFRPQAHLIAHPHKIVWFIHHIRAFYDLWNSPYRGFPHDAKHSGIRAALQAIDDAALRECHTIFANSKIVSSRLQLYNNLDSEVLYPPIYRPERFHCLTYSDEIICICRLEHHKRQHVLVEAMRYTKTAVRLRLMGEGSASEYVGALQQRILVLSLSERIVLDNRWISEAEKVDCFATCLANAYVPLDEDSYGYPSVEASYASKATLTTSDSGGVLELVQDGITGYVSDPSPQALADAMDRLYLDRRSTEIMGNNARARLFELNISWPHVLQRLLT